MILTLGYHDRSAPRHTNVCKTFEDEGQQITDCHTTRRGFFAKYADLAKKYRKIQKDVDTVLVTFPGHYLMPLAWLLTRFPRKKLIFDAFISLSDTLVDDRKKYSWSNPIAWWLYMVDFISCHMADEILIDTKAHKDFFAQRFYLNPNRIRVIYLGTRDDLFHPSPNPNPIPIPNPNPTPILFYGTYIPLQGIEYILDAAAILQKSHPELHFTLIGKGQTYPAMRDKAKALKLTNVNFVDPVPYEELPGWIQNAQCCLGIFGTTAKAGRVIPHKVYDAIACGKLVITADTPSIRELFADHPQVMLCKAGNGESIAEAILKGLGLPTTGKD